MNDSDKKAFAELMTGAAEMYSKTLSKNLMSMYFDALKRVDIDEIRIAFSKHAIDSKAGSFFPKPADIIRQINSNKPSIEDRASIAWMEVESALSKYSASHGMQSEDKQLLMALRNMGGFYRLAMTNLKDLHWKRKQFIENYKAIDSADIGLLENLNGFKELENQRGEVKKISDLNFKEMYESTGQLPGLKDESK